VHSENNVQDLYCIWLYTSALPV